MICLHCDNEKFEKHANTEIEQEFRGEKLRVISPAMVCTQCGWQNLTADQVDILRRKVADKYREKHGLLTSDQIKERRKRMGLSQTAFAKRLGVGVASIKRWETWLVQDRSSDRLIRQFTQPKTSSQHAAFKVLRVKAPKSRAKLMTRLYQRISTTNVQRTSWFITRGRIQIHSQFLSGTSKTKANRKRHSARYDSCVTIAS